MACTTAFRDGFVGRQSDERDAPVAQDNVVLQWNDALLQTVRTVPFLITARALAILHTSMYDAWAAYDPIAVGTRFGGDLRRPDDEHTDANKAQAISFAAYRALVDLFPTQQTVLFDPLMESLGYDPSDTTTDTSTPDRHRQRHRRSRPGLPTHGRLQSARRSQSRCLFRVPAALRPSQRP